MSARYWFRPKTFGYGWTPISWEGWAVTLASMAVSVAVILTAVLAEVQRWPDRRSLQTTCLIVWIATLAVTIMVARSKTETGG